MWKLRHALLCSNIHCEYTVPLCGCTSWLLITGHPCFGLYTYLPLRTLMGVCVCVRWGGCTQHPLLLTCTTSTPRSYGSWPIMVYVSANVLLCVHRHIRLVTQLACRWYNQHYIQRHTRSCCSANNMHTYQIWRLSDIHGPEQPMYVIYLQSVTM